MKTIIIFLLSLAANLTFAQCNENTLFDYFSEPVIDENGQLFISFDVSEKTDKSCVIEFIDIEGNLNYHDGESKSISFKNLLPTAKTNKSVKFYIDKKVTKLLKEISNYQWTELRYTLNFKINDQNYKTQELRYVNQKHYKDTQNKIIIKNFTKYAKSKKVTLYLEAERSIGKIEGIDILNGQNTIASTEAREIDSRNNLFQINCKNDLEDCISSSVPYTIRVNYSDINGSQSKIDFPRQFVSQKDVFTINTNDIKENMAYGNVAKKLSVKTTLPAKELYLTFSPSPIKNTTELNKLKFAVETGTNEYQFNIPSNEGTFEAGKYNISFSGKDSNMNDLEQNTSFVFEKKNAQIETLQTDYNNKNGESRYIITFPESLTKNSIVELRLGSSASPFRMVPDTNYSKYSFTFNYSDTTITNYLQSVDRNKKEIAVQFFVDGIPASPQYLAPLKIITKEELQKEMEEKLSRSEKKDKVAIKKFLEEKDVRGNLDQAAEAAIEEFSKNVKNRTWSEVWTKVLKIAPSVLGALVMLI